MNNKFLKALFLLKSGFYSILFYPLKPRKSKIVFCSFNGTNFSAQPKMIFDELQSRDIKGLDIVWILPDDYPHTERFRTVKPNSIKSIYELSTASVWIDNARKGLWAKKKNSQLYIQTWHGPVCLKAVEADCKKALSLAYILGAKRDSRNADYLVAETEWRLNNIKRAFWYDGEIVKGEFKKKAFLCAEESVKRVKNFYGLNEDDKIILYVPTFRKDNNLDCYDIDYQRVLSVLNSENGNHYKFIIRLHPNIASLEGFIDYSDWVLNGTLYNSVDELIAASDMIISDYSGCIFEGYRAEKPVFLYAKDLEDYIAGDRSLYFDIKNLPSPVAYDNDGLIEAFLSFDETKYKNDIKEFNKKIGYYDTDASKIIVDLIIKRLEY